MGKIIASLKPTKASPKSCCKRVMGRGERYDQQMEKVSEKNMQKL